MSLIAPDFLTVDYDAMRGEDIPNPDGWVFHWPAATHAFIGLLAESKRYLKAWEDYHVNSHGWRGIAYDYAVDQAGRKFRLRGTGRSAATSGDYDEDGVPNNTETDAILCIIGIGQRPSTQMVEAARELIAELGGRRDYIIPHYAAGGIVTDCPGPYVTRDIVDVLNSLEDDMPLSDDDVARVAAAVHNQTINRTGVTIGTALDRSWKTSTEALLLLREHHDLEAIRQVVAEEVVKAGRQDAAAVADATVARLVERLAE